MRRLDYHTSIQIWLSLEDYHNAGMTSWQTKNVIESIRDPYLPNTNLHCEPAGLNGNWIVRTWAPMSAVDEVVEDIRWALEAELKGMKS